MALSPNSFVMERDVGCPPGFPVGHFLRALKGPLWSIHSLCCAPNVVAFVEGVGREVYTFPGNFERGRPVGGVLTKHTAGVSHSHSCLLGAGWFLVSLPSEVKGFVPKGIRKRDLPRVRLLNLTSCMKAERNNKKMFSGLSP